MQPHSTRARMNKRTAFADLFTISRLLRSIEIPDISASRAEVPAARRDASRRRPMTVKKENTEIHKAVNCSVDKFVDRNCNFAD